MQRGCGYTQRYEGHVSQLASISRAEGKGAQAIWVCAVRSSKLNLNGSVFAAPEYGTGVYGHFRARQIAGGSNG